MIKPSYKELIFIWTKIGAMSFGGPAAQILLMFNEIVERRKWLEERAFNSALSFCMLLPGPEAMQLATYLGWRTHGVLGGELIKVRDSFRQYDSYDESIADYGSYLQQNKRYKPMLQAATLQEQVEALGKSGYATDPKYADKVMAIAKSKRLEAL